MKITFLGTGTSQGVPVIACDCESCQSNNPKDKRLRSSILIEHEGTNIVIDSGPDFRQQMLRANVKKLDAILFTHPHKDHTGGLDDVRAYNYVQKKPMQIFAENNVLDSLKMEYHYVFHSKYPGIPQIDMQEIKGKKAFKVGKLTITPIRLMHLSLPILGFRIGDFTYITDANHIPSSAHGLIKGTKILVINALRIERHISHFSLGEALWEIERIRPRKAFLTHISHLMPKTDILQDDLPVNVSLAYDGLEVEI